MNNIQIYNYGGTNDVTFKTEDGAIYINATDMAQSFNKLPADYLSNKNTKEYISAVSVAMGIPISQLVSVIHGVGTWMHEDIAIDFAQWLSPQFRVWCNSRLKELARHGITATADAIEQMINNPDAMITLLQTLKSERAEKEQLRIDNEAKKVRLAEMRPKELFYDAVTDSKTAIDMGRVAKVLDMGGYTVQRRPPIRSKLYRHS